MIDGNRATQSGVKNKGGPPPSDNSALMDYSSAFYHLNILVVVFPPHNKNLSYCNSLVCFQSDKTSVGENKTVTQ